jgi:eukaryotic-like serine/threonine-protein kinase
MSSTGTLAAGTLVAGRYHIEEPLAGDGSGAVYRAADTRLDRAVALRALPSSEAGGAQQGKAAARLVHPNVARVLDFGTDVELATEFVVADLGTGGSLAALLAQRGVPPLPLALRMIQEAAAGMAAAHRAGLVHGDLHPGVLWLSRDEGRLRVQVLGLGLNPAGAPPPRATARYASPERLRRARELSAAADVFSLGVVAYEVFAGLPADWTQLLLQMARGQAVVAPSLLEARPDLPAHVAQAVRRALAADPASRWPDAGDFAAHLIADLASQPHAETPAAAVPVPAIVAAPVEAAVATPAPVAAPVSAPTPVIEAVSAPVVEAAPEPVAVSTEPEAPVEAQTVAAEDEEDVATVAEQAVRALANAGPRMEQADFAEPEPVVAESADVAEPEPVVPEAADLAQPEPVVTEAAAAPSLEPVAESVTAEVIPAIAEANPVVTEVIPAVEPIASAEPVTPAVVEAPKPTRQPLTAGRRGKPIALASTDLADTLYIPPTLEKQPAATASAEKTAQAPAASPPAKIVAPPMMAAPVEPVAKVEPVAPRPEPTPVVAAAPVVEAQPLPSVATVDETLAAAPVVAAYAPPAGADPQPVQESAAVVPVADIPLMTERRKRRGGLQQMGQPSPSHRRGLLAASIAVALLVVGGVVAKTVLAGNPDAAPAVQALASSAAAAAGGAPAPGQPQAPAADSAVPTTVADTAALPNAALTPEEQRKQAEDRRKLEEQRRQQQRQQDSLRQVQLAAQAAQQTAALPQVAIQNAPRASMPTAAPQLEQRAPTAAAAPATPAPAPETARPAAADPNRVYSADELTTRPSLANGSAFRSAVNRTYPPTLRGSNTWGSAVVTFVVLPDGRVDRSSISVAEASQAAFRSAAAAAISNARFNPARVGGQAVRTTVSMPITWQPSGQDDD